jgi:hypothetical protein
LPDPSLIDRLTDLIVEAANDALDGINPNLPALTPANAAAARTDLQNLINRAQDVTNAGDPVAWVNAMGDWRQALRDLATHAFGDDDKMLVRLLQERMPRTAAFLALIGVISNNDIDWPKLRQFASDPGTLVNEAFWDALLGDAGIPGTGRLPAVLAGLLLLFPQTILALARGNLSAAPLLEPPSDPGPWRTYRDNSADWISITVPFPDPAKPDAQKVPASILDLVADLNPNLSATIGIRSNRRTVAGKGRTDFELWLGLVVDDDRWQYDLGSEWFVRVEPGISGGFGYDGSWHGAFRPISALNKPQGPDDPVVASLGRELPAGAPDIALGPPYDTRLIIKDLGVFLKLRENHPIFEIGLFVHGFSAVLTNRWWRTFGATNTLFGEGIRFDLNLDLAYVESRGVMLNLGAGLDVTFDLDWTPLGDRDPAKRGFDLTIHSIRLVIPLQATQDDLSVRGEVRFHASLRIGPVILVVDGLGGWVGYWKDNPTASRKYVGFLPPTGAGLELVLPMVTGGGFLDFTGGPNDKFGGLIYLKIGPVEVTAFGLHELTGQAGEANRKTSLIVVIGIRFSPGIQLGFGFAITGFGGLVGINRRSDTDALRERLTSGAAGNVLFAEDPVRNAPQILGDLGALFPPAAGVYVFGPTIQLTWLSVAGKSFAKLDVGIFIELPGPSKIVLLGSLRAEIPGADVLLHLRLDFVGLIDFQKKVIEFDATLIDSHALGIFVITGDAAFRSSYGDQPYVMLTIGGFHPDFNPEPAVFPELTRVALTLKTPTTVLFLRFEAYLAVTTNSFQVGGQLEVGIHAGPLNAIGFVSLDALIQFIPFHFEVAISAGFRVRWNALTLAGVKITGTLTGPGPVTVTGSFCIELLFFDICWSDSFSLGGGGEPAAAPVGSTAQALQSELTEPSNVEADGGDDAHAAQQSRGTPPARALISPIGALVWTQRRVPLNLLIDRFEGRPLAQRQSLRLTAARPGQPDPDPGLPQNPVVDWFSPGSFANLNDSERLNRPSFERLGAGLRFGFGDDAATPSVHSPQVIEIRLPQPPVISLLLLALPAVTVEGILARNGAAAVKTTAAKVTAADEQFVVRAENGSIAETARSRSDAYARAKAYGGVALHEDDVVEVAGL